MATLKSLSRSLELLWIVLFMLLLGGMAWYLDGTDEIGEMAYHDLRTRVEQMPALAQPYGQAMADGQISRAEYRHLYRLYQSRQSETTVGGLLSAAVADSRP